MSEKNNANQQVNNQRSNSNSAYSYQKNSNTQAYYPNQQAQPNRQFQKYPYQQYQQFPYQPHQQYQQFPYQPFQQYQQFPYQQYQPCPQFQQQYMQNQYPFTYPPYQTAPQQPYPGAAQGMPTSQQSAQNFGNMMPMEQSYIENILRLNLGKRARVHMTFEQGGKEGNVKVFEGIVQAAGRDHIVLSDPDTGEWYLLLMIYLDYVTFPERINYQYPYGRTPSFAAYSPR